MNLRELYRRSWKIIAVAVCAFVLGGLFFARQPVLIVGDAGFTAIYGQKRLERRKALLTLTLFRRVVPVQIADDVGQDMVSVAVSVAAKKAYCVIFPYRYQEGAARYAREFPTVPVILLNGRRQDAPPDNGGAAPNLQVLCADLREDFYKAGKIAAVLALDAQERDAEKKSKHTVALYQEDLLQGSSLSADAFNRGLKDGRWTASPQILSKANASRVDGELNCAVLAGAVPAQSVLNQHRETFLVLFSWIDPKQAGDRAVVLFDDSPWGVAGTVVRNMKRGVYEKKGALTAALEAGAPAGQTEQEKKLISSKIVTIFAGIHDKGLVKKLKNVI